MTSRIQIPTETLRFQPVTPVIIDHLQALVGSSHVSTVKTDRRMRSFDVSGHPPHLSEVVVWPQTAQQTGEILQLANDERIPVTP